MSGKEYPNFAALKAACQEGADYVVETLERDLTIAVIAPHGRCIEPGTEIIARAIAGSDLSLHVFEALKPGASPTLHITSTHYDEPNALRLVSKCRVAIGIHGRKDQQDEAGTVWMGGRNTIARSAVTAALIAAGFPAIEITGPLAAQSPENICNRAIEHGVQLEIPRSLRKSLEASPHALQAFASAVRSGLGVQA